MQNQDTFTQALALEQRYEIYVESMKGSGEYIKSFDEWLNS